MKLVIALDTILLIVMVKYYLDIKKSLKYLNQNNLPIVKKNNNQQL